ncbi:sugar ABC transporter substrate-binding protein [Marispirochaeta sp.]|uniref:ABC transporter substrate-binding protein n=1 Tax=Marispirochaeta sp. TaxID=2038653 RepID=UPI0029C941B9|nr:sugar ABC transporter substrate-binding protein [Marispirochaeta sp.]
MKKSVFASLLFLLVFLFVYAEGGQEKAKDQEIVLEFMQWWEPEMAPGAMEKICSQYEASHPGITIKRISKPYAEVQSQVTIGAASGTLSDVLGCDPTWIYNLVKQNAVRPLDEFIDGDNYDESQLASVSSLNGKKYLINVENFVYPMFYNTDMFEEAGITSFPETHSEFVEACRKLTNPSKNQYGWDLSLSLQNPTGIQNDIMAMVWASGDSGVPEPNNEGVKTVFELVNSLYNENLIAPGIMTAQEQDKVEHFVNGRTAMMIDSLAHINMIKSRNPDLNFDIDMVPAKDGYEGEHIMDFASWGITISSSSEHPQEAWEFIKYLMSPSVNSFIADSVNAFPGNIKGSPKWVNDDPMNVKAFTMYKENGVRNEFQGAPEANNLMRLMSEQMQAMLNGKQSADEALEATSAAWVEVYNK